MRHKTTLTVGTNRSALGFFSVMASTDIFSSIAVSITWYCHTFSP
ncbi:hypothetical protein CP10139811_0522 [Chlamydia ibidis]|uniref:Uncharacterized protein n=2 Tax=Chlamydia ibidis TaxID=1405396 RepID=S7J293_9CHLA|nr:hypothetical protein CP10139811_0522 [Chlamydia ibidis]EQM62436.1 hypothetical protein H359_0901 [Chlamydia ibidis 10-1398/6]